MTAANLAPALILGLLIIGISAIYGCCVPHIHAPWTGIWAVVALATFTSLIFVSDGTVMSILCILFVTIVVIHRRKVLFTKGPIS